MLNSNFEFDFDLTQGLFHLQPASGIYPGFHAASLALDYIINGIEKIEQLKGFIQLGGEQKIHDPIHGELLQVTSTCQTADSALQITTTFALLEKHPLFIWKMQIQNISSQPVYVHRIEMVRVGVEEEKGSQFTFSSQKPADMAFFTNGWQSWSYAGAYNFNQRQRRSILGPFQLPQVVNPGTAYTFTRGRHTSDFFGVIADKIERKGLVLGFLSQRQHFGTLEANFDETLTARLWANGDDARLDPGASMTTDWAVITPIAIDDPDPMREYLQAVAREHEIKENGTSPVGWCSWYQFYSKVTAVEIERNLLAFSAMQKELPLDLFQIDDGYQAQVSDWLDFRDTFPSGVQGFATRAKKAGFTPGLWLAPFIVHPHSRLRHDHPDWILRSRHGRPVNTGFAWNVFNTALDLTNTAALDYAAHVVDVAAHQWGFPYLKLDFLFAAAVKCKYQDDSLTRAQVMRHGLERLRLAAGKDTFLLGCGVPLGSALGIFQSLRIGPDVLESWRPKWFGTGAIFRHEPHMPSAKNSIQNILARSFTHRRWWINDPDCLLVRPNMDLSLAEVQSLATAIAMTGGALLLSDDLPALPRERIRLATCLIPPLDRRPQVLDWLDAQTPTRLRIDLENQTGKWHLLAYFNWLDYAVEISLNPIDFKLPVEGYHVRSFWDKVSQTPTTGSPLYQGKVPAHGVFLLAARPVREGQVQYVGSDLHFTQGNEVSRWKAENKKIVAQIKLGRTLQGEFELSLPHAPKSARVGERDLAWKKAAPNHYIFSIQADDQADFEINW